MHFMRSAKFTIKSIHDYIETKIAGSDDHARGKIAYLYLLVCDSNTLKRRDYDV